MHGVQPKEVILDPDQETKICSKGVIPLWEIYPIPASLNETFRVKLATPTPQTTPTSAENSSRTIQPTPTPQTTPTSAEKSSRTIQPTPPSPTTPPSTEKGSRKRTPRQEDDHDHPLPFHYRDDEDDEGGNGGEDTENTEYTASNPRHSKRLKESGSSSSSSRRQTPAKHRKGYSDFMDLEAMVSGADESDEEESSTDDRMDIVDDSSEESEPPNSVSRTKWCTNYCTPYFVLFFPFYPFVLLLLLQGRPHFASKPPRGYDHRILAHVQQENSYLRHMINKAVPSDSDSERDEPPVKVRRIMNWCTTQKEFPLTFSSSLRFSLKLTINQVRPASPESQTPRNRLHHLTSPPVVTRPVVDITSVSTATKIPLLLALSNVMYSPL